jgi:hypothetical protein
VRLRQPGRESTHLGLGLPERDAVAQPRDDGQTPIATRLR